jgi:hypothetical protein
MTKVFIATLGAIAHFACAADAPQPSAAEKARARILQAFPYNPGHASDKTGSNIMADTTPAVLLPKVIVQATKPLVLPTEELLSRAELSALVRKKYPGASLKGQDPLHYEGGIPNYGALLYSEDKRVVLLKNLTDLSDALLKAGDVDSSKELRKVVQEAAVRRPDALREAMDKSANNGRR